ncbi:hypothetical protein EMIHUDRAFT_105678 [Emiliania huxleyi CCMP1516]|uniref:U-box domain-containing protein n=2 Tax=Emiliania huxleyi TaxID=2903 RepID=A0A0D3I0G3_EMIH1|nr:hypothetical protein EMIHUDRAFT_107642 [Emiliania huxleyi CCMP1516]XP_005761746.1 hypothetical protein EMIHUDRAFT_105678 [Emiliania huxleyi CCMP1516]EOD04748.1 hypothetical protein EMIHUDRAFT_107642 [Emiliania huxleyi CCMP1516]EOD09317.1 hypothetical protein EMIHUDRAFT_105678 [Emiliania huxleyi CCMP1516]|eukprot:XP_005757177.1 hypothetical protein EMIHUDRAFT_107642 [Emiliania huxleyi CCMP1516]
MPPRKRAADAVTEEDGKRFRSAIDEMAEEFVCPITQELPVDPVTAEDGRVYERSAIEAHIKGRSAEALKSPMTNEPMGPRLFPAVQVRNNIERMIKSGAIGGDKAAAWKQRIEEEKVVAKTRTEAEGGDAVAMSSLGFWYRDGKHGLQVDQKQAFEWFERAAELDDPRGLTACARILLEGRGVSVDTARGLVMLGQAIGQGSEQACYWMGRIHQRGCHGLKMDDKQVARWFRKMPGCSFKNGSADSRDNATKWLREHPSA